ncbi:MAG: septum formation initiator family protein [Chloroflexi bacterium]|nr:septum formation initiator family protein [Chloroflexota bacterium]
MLKHLPRISSTRIVLGVTAIIVGYFLVMGAVTALRSSQLSDREDRLRAEIAELQQRYERLEMLREYLGSDEYIEAVAREQLGLVREGENGIVVISTAPSSAPDPDAPDESELWWETLTR